ncbi:MAG: hypothetical protein RMZ43_018665 [Nostoc sp. CmiVER01]|uniref:hypothetical protein n=1 Tax=Nostoc sp. CmiVER01 TaxID=3075384 RepID=UPI002AD29D2E|nr:hypothetical protein [Nostoc sp. CmiVER01]MDZ8126805.1 hypothetical protein [Nostoc sp. CmiVER01]
MVSRFEMGIYPSGKFGLSLEAGVGLWCAIGWWGCRSFLTKLTRLIACYGNQSKKFNIKQILQFMEL